MPFIHRQSKVTSDMKPANPENVPLDKIPAGWRLIYEEEFNKPIPRRLWNPETKQFGSFGNMEFRQRSQLTYITPDLPDNGQPWHAHKPGDPAPVEDGVAVDVVCRDGVVVSKANSPRWKSNGDDGRDILFYCLHEPSPMQTESPTSDRILSILIAAGYITEEQVEQARQLVKDKTKWAAPPNPSSARPSAS